MHHPQLTSRFALLAAVLLLPAGPLPAQDAPVEVRATAAASRVHRLAGPLSVPGATAADRARSFSATHGARFGGEAAAAQLGAPRLLGQLPDGTPRHSHTPQLVHGTPLEGHGLTLRFDEHGRVAVAHGVLSEAATRLPPAALDTEQARAIGLAALAARGVDATELSAPPRVQPVARLVNGEPRLLWRVQGLRERVIPLAVDVDAHSGQVLRVFENVVHGGSTGTFSYDGTDTTFQGKKGKGYAYKKVSHALTANDRLTALKNMAHETLVPQVAIDGMLVGRYAQIFQQDGVAIVSLNHTYPYRDDEPGTLQGWVDFADLFDHTNTYFWINQMGDFIGRTLGTNPIDRTMPVFVNFDDGGLGYNNAFFSPATLGGSGELYGPGYFVFGEFDVNTLDVMDDLSRDPSVVCHEYVHGVVDGLGATFGDADLDTPERAVNEALADYGAATFLNDPAIGLVYATHSGTDIGWTDPSLRDLTLPLTLPDNLADTLGFTTGLPEEHEAGEIFAAFLWRARQALKSRTADPLILGNLLDWPQGSAEVGFPSVTPGNAEDAYAAFYHACMSTLMNTVLDGTGNAGKLQRNAGRLLGAALAQGLTGVSGGPVWRFEDAHTDGLKLAFGSAFLGTLDSHSFEVSLAAGQQITVALKGDKKSATQVDFTIDQSAGALDFQKDKKTNALGTKVVQARIGVVTTGTYLFTFSNPDSGGGAYSARLRVK